MKKILKNNSIIITALCIMIAIVWYLNYTDGDKTKMVTGDNVNTEVVMDGATFDENLLTENGLELKDLMQAENKSMLENNVVADLETPEAYADEDLNVGDIGMDISDEDIAAAEAAATGEGDEMVALDSTVGETIVSDNGELLVEDETTNPSTPGEAVLASTSISSNFFSSAKLTREQNRAREKESLLEMMDSDTLTDEVKQKAVDSYLALTDIMEKENATELLLEAKGFDGAVVTIIDNCVDVVINAPTITEQQIAQIESIVERKTEASAENIVISPVVVEE